MPTIGLRNIKTAISVVICLFIFIIVLGINYACTGSFVGATKWYTPFFAALASAYSVATSKQESLRQAKIRIVASVIGGLVGVLFVFLYIKISNCPWPFSLMNSIGVMDEAVDPISYLLSMIVPCLLVGFCTMIVIHICVICNQKQAAFVSVLTLTAVMCSLGTDPIQYGFTRILSTVIGVLVALGVNLFHLPRYNNKSRLFLLGIDGEYVADDNKIDGFAKFTLNSLSFAGANISLLTTKTPAFLIPMLQDVQLNCPIICMSGSALYDINTKKYLYLENISEEVSNKVQKELKKLYITPIINLVEQDVLYSYCAKIDNQGMHDFVEQRRNSAYGCYVPYIAPKGECLYMVLVVENHRVDEIVNHLNNCECSKDILVLVYDYYLISGHVEGYSYIKIYSTKVNDLKVLDYIKNDVITDRVGVIMHKNDIHILDNVDYSIITYNITDDMKEKCNEILPNKNFNSLLKKVRKLFHKRKIKE